MESRLEGVRVAVLVADGFEQIEVSLPVRALRRAGADVRIISLRPGRLRGVNLIWRGSKLPVDDTFSMARADDYGAVYVPGGFVNPDLLRQSARARDFIRRADALDRPIAVMCHGPELLVSAGLVRGRQLTSWPGIADDLKNAGAVWLDQSLVADRNWVSSRGPHDLFTFIPAMIDLFDAKATRGLVPLRPRVRWMARASQVLTVGLAGLLLARLFGRVSRRRRGLGLGGAVLPLLAAVGARYGRRLMEGGVEGQPLPEAPAQPPRSEPEAPEPRVVPAL